MPADLGVMNAANLCPSPAPVIEALVAATRDMDRDPSFPNRVKMGEGKEATRRLLAEFLRVSPEEIILARNTSEASNLVSSGLDLKAGDEVLLFSDNHPSNLDAWKIKARRFGYTVKVVDPDQYLCGLYEEFPDEVLATRRRRSAPPRPSRHSGLVTGAHPER